MTEESPQILSKPSSEYENFMGYCSEKEPENEDDTIRVEVEVNEGGEEELDRESTASSTMTPMKMRRSFSGKASWACLEIGFKMLICLS